MSVQNPRSNPTPPASRWRLWVDGCGGYLILDGDCWSVGGFSESSPADICVRADWPRLAGTIKRLGEDYFWLSSNAETPEMIDAGHSVPIPGSASMTFAKPSRLCGSATLRLQNPHRFIDHIDEVVLFADSLLIGADTDCHVRSTDLTDRVVVTRRDGIWLARAGRIGEFTQLSIGTRSTVSSITMMLETA